MGKTQTSKIKTYSPKDIFIKVGAYLITEFQKVTVEKDDDEFTSSVCTTGHMTRTYNPSMAGKVTIVLPQTTPQNKQMLDEHKRILAGYAQGEFSKITIADKLGNSLHTMTEGTCTKRPNGEYDKDPTDREWGFFGELGDHDPAGN